MNRRIWKYLQTRNLHGLLAGFMSALIGSIVFSIGEFIHLEFVFNESISSSTDFTFLIYIFIYCALFSFIPSGIGGWILGLLLQNRSQKGSITVRNGVFTGSFLAGLAAIFICVSVIMVIFVMPSRDFSFGAIDNKGIGNFIVEVFRAFIREGSYFGIEIIAGILIASLLGGWSSRIIAKQMIETKGNI